LATIAVLEVVRILVVHESQWTHGSTGISLPLNIGWTWIVFRNKLNYLIIAFGLFLFVLWISWLIRKARVGHYLLALREQENAARAVGIHTFKMKTFAAVISAMLTSIVGTFHITYLTFIDPASAFSLMLSIQIAMLALIGGLGTIAGPIAGTFLVLPIAEMARVWLSGAGNGFHGLVYGVILVIVVLTIPRGIVGIMGVHVERVIGKFPYLGRKKEETANISTAVGVAVDTDKYSTSNNTVLEAKGLFKNFGGLRATNDVSLILHENEILG